MSSYIITHKQFDLPFSQYKKEQYKVICPKGTTIENWPNIIYFDSNLDNKLWGELAAMDWIARNDNDDWICINHYRRILEPMPGVISHAQQVYFPTNLGQQYADFHNIMDLHIVSNIIKQIFPNLYNVWLYTLQSNIFYPYNIVSFPNPTFKDYMGKIMTVLSTYLNAIGVKTKDDMLNRIKSNVAYTTPNGKRNIDAEYQSRVVGFLAERLTSWYINILYSTRQYNIQTCHVNKYDGAW